jgi:Uma2 family endonuclease
MTVADSILKPTRKYWTKEEYYRLVDLGGFEGQRVFLFRGEIIQRPPKKHPHACTIMQMSRILFAAYDAAFSIRVQLPFEAVGDSEPEPDFLVCHSSDGRRERHPNTALLVIEVAWTSVQIDKEKAKEYAAANIPEYWLIDVDQRQLVRYARPIRDATSETGFIYSESRVLGENETIEFPALRDRSMKLKDCLPE